MEKEENRVEVDYVQRNNLNSNSLEMCGRLSHTLKMKKKMSQQFTDKIRNKYMESEKNNKTIKTKSRLYDGPTKSKLRSTSPIQVGGLDLRKRIIHMLAPKPMKLTNLSKMLKIKETEPELISILNNISTKNQANEYKLNSDIYKEVEFQTWHTWDHNQRSQAIENGKKAFEEINLPSSAPEWNKLVQKKALNISAPVIQPVNSLISNTNDTNQRKINPIATEKRATKQLMSQMKSRGKKANASTVKAVKVKRNDNIPIANHSVQQAQAQAEKRNMEKLNSLANSIIANNQETTENEVEKKPSISKRNNLGKSNSIIKEIDRLPKIKKKSLAEMKKQMAESSQNEKEDDINSLSAPILKKLTNKRKRMDSASNSNLTVLQAIEPLVINEPISTFTEYNNMIEKYNKHQQELQKLDKSMKDISESYNKRRRDLKEYDSTDLLERRLYTEFKEKAEELLMIKNQYNSIYNNLQQIKEKLDLAKENLINSI
ncbi:hypothetical protein PIROE2DRAFT_6533 [Piromyces sp. E2]|nr:hypothetical protein PIROE2DRAFT_6533 [Piromyces sp. E2]|eukprot:OUM66295.1 hypothetical protein PIROE2DRAFT_6533 [Piromyces sp. E2]